MAALSVRVQEQKVHGPRSIARQIGPSEESSSTHFRASEVGNHGCMLPTNDSNDAAGELVLSGKVRHRHQPSMMLGPAVVECELPIQLPRIVTFHTG